MSFYNTKTYLGGSYVLESKDLEAIRSIMKEELRNTENLVLGELDRVQEKLTDKIGLVKKNMEELQQYYKISKLENDNTSLLLQMITDLNKRLQELEKRSA